jgi:hypothetical protein
MSGEAAAAKRRVMQYDSEQFGNAFVSSTSILGNMTCQGDINALVIHVEILEDAGEVHRLENGIYRFGIWFGECSKYNDAGFSVRPKRYNFRHLTKSTQLITPVRLALETVSENFNGTFSQIVIVTCCQFLGPAIADNRRLSLEEMLSHKRKHVSLYAGQWWALSEQIRSFRAQKIPIVFHTASAANDLLIHAGRLASSLSDSDRRNLAGRTRLG